MTSPEPGSNDELHTLIRELRSTCLEALTEARDSFAWSAATEALVLSMLADHPNPEVVRARLLSTIDDLADIPHLTNSRTFADTVEKYRAVLDKYIQARRQ